MFTGLQDEDQDPAPAEQAAQPVRTIPPTAPATETIVAMGQQPHSGLAPSVAATSPSPKKSPFTNMPPWARAPRRVASAEIPRDPATTPTGSVTAAGEQPEEEEEEEGNEGVETQRGPGDGPDSCSGTDWPSHQPSHRPESNVSSSFSGSIATAWEL
jgi:hypothetical protein